MLNFAQHSIDICIDCEYKQMPITNRTLKLSLSSLIAFTLLFAIPETQALDQVLSQFIPGETSPAGWMAIGKFAQDKDDQGRPYVTGEDNKLPGWLLSEQDFSGNYRIDAVVQLTGRGEGKAVRWREMTLAWGVKAIDTELTIGREIGYTGDGAKGYQLRIVTTTENKSLQIPNPEGFHVTRTAPEELLQGIPLTDRVHAATRFRMIVRPCYLPEDISPAWDEQFRLSAERDYAAIPETGSVWARIRVDVTPGNARVYRDGLFFQELPVPPPTEGRVLVQVPPGVKLASLIVTRFQPTEEQFYPIPLDEIVNAAGNLDGKSLPQPGLIKTLEGIPFLFPPRSAGGDHVDIGKSLFRFRETSGSYDGFSSPRVTWRPASTLDPERLMVRVPKRSYGKLWVVAGAANDPGKIPVLTARFFKPLAGFPVDAETEIPALTATTGTAGAKQVEVKTADGKKSSLWIVPLDLDTAAIASRFRDEPFLNIELTKKVHDYRTAPDPVSYDSFQGGLPSSVQLYAATLQEAPFTFLSDGTRPGKVYTSPERPDWAVDVKNLSQSPKDFQVSLAVRGPDGFSSNLEKKIQVAAEGEQQVKFAPETGKFGHYTVETTVEGDGISQKHSGAFLLLPPDQRKATGKTTRWGLWYWTYHDVSLNHEDNLKILRALGARTGIHAPYELRKKYDIGPPSEKLSIRRMPWAMDTPDDPEAFAAYVAEASEKTQKILKEVPDLEYMLPYAEQMISLRITHGMPPWALGDKPFAYDKGELQRKKAYLVQAKAANEAVKNVSKDIETMLGSCAAVFAVPLLEDGVSKDSFDGIGLDLPQFERMPERQPRATEPSLLYFGREARDRLGYGDKPFHHFESYFPSSHPLANGERGHAQSIVRTAVLSMALGSERFIECWTFQDPSDYWGSSHYAGGGMMTRQPEFNPKPGAAAYATMTQVLDTAKYDGYLPTGSLSSYCVRFKDPDKLIYAMWTFNGIRPVSVSVSEGTKLVKVDESGNESSVPVTDGKASLELSPTPFWLLAKGGGVEKLELGDPSYAQPSDSPTVLLDNFDRADWSYSQEPLPGYADNHWDVRRLPGQYDFSFDDSADRGGKVLKASLKKAGDGPMVGWYAVFNPPKPIAIPGKARALGIWAKGNSGWGRVIYELVDAQGQILRNIGTKDQFNCDDIHSWSSLNFDGWKYMEFPLPGNLPGDNYREKDVVWWGHSENKPVKLPLKLTRIIVEMPTNIIYVNEMIPVKDQLVELDDLVAVYDNKEMMTDLPITIQTANEGIFVVAKTDSSTLPNPVKDLLTGGVGEPTRIDDVLSPEMQNDGTRARVKVEPMAAAKSYKIWLSAYPDGAGAKPAPVTPEEGEPGSLLVRGLAPAVPLYLFATYLDEEGKESKPSPARKVVLKDEFPFK